MRAKVKFLAQILTGMFFLILLVASQKEGFTMTIRVGEVETYSFTTIILPYIKEAIINLGILYIPFSLLSWWALQMQ